ncbi:MAG: hypothetical protein C0507_04755 [Cyanobacteria bacterium PR.3.49]|nr:hypothetical protein [Cyanobacteria bacterium PR.3.49]
MSDLEVMFATPRAPNKSTSSRALVSVLVLALSSLVLAMCLFLTWNIVSEAGWPTAKGVVDHTFIGTRKDPFSRQGRIVNCLNLAYSYEVDGKKFFSVSELEYSKSEAEMLSRSHDFGSGTVISVRYCPKKPQTTYLNHEMAEAPIPVLVTVAAFCLLCAIGALSTIVLDRLSQPKLM